MRSNLWSLLGIPDHQGVLNVGGRAGALWGPLAFRRAWVRLRGPKDLNLSVTDCGDLGPVPSPVVASIASATRAIAGAHAKTGLSVVIGGGHDHGFSQLQGVAQALALQAKRKTKLRLGCINIDAHLDVRPPNPEINSGSPFYLALEEKVLEPSRLVEFGIQPQANGPSLWEYVRQKKIRVVPFARLRGGKAARAFALELRKLEAKCDAIVVSVDLDSLSEAAAPGVAAPQAEGFSAEDLLAMMEVAGARKKVISLGIFELNPEHDREDQTARVAATAVHRFLSSRFKFETY